MSNSIQIFHLLQESLNCLVLGQDRLIERLLISMLADGHLLVEGAPGLAKTRAIKELGEKIVGEFHRIQFTPDLLPADADDAGDDDGGDVEIGRASCRERV